MLKFNLVVFGLIPNNFSLISLLSLIIFATHVNAIFENISFITDEEMKAAELTYELDIKTPVNGFNLSNGSYYEGDILLPNIPESPGLHWPNGRVPYILESSYNDNERQKIASAFLFFKQNTCIRWVAKQESDSDWVFITSSKNECSSSLGLSSFTGMLNLGKRCLSLQTIIHVMMHRIGFIHEQSRPDRDQYIQIIEENIKNSTMLNFDKWPLEYFDKSYNLPYDIHSVMHYEEYAFSKNAKMTIKAKNGKLLGCRQSEMKCPTDLDIEKINIVYNCQKKSKKKACGTVACLEESFNSQLENYVKAYNLKIKETEEQMKDKINLYERKIKEMNNKISDKSDLYESKIKEMNQKISDKSNLYERKIEEMNNKISDKSHLYESKIKEMNKKISDKSDLYERKIEEMNPKFSGLIHRECRFASEFTFPVNYHCWIDNGVLRFQEDGNFVIYDNCGKPLWHTRTGNGEGHVAKFQHDGNFVLYDIKGRAIWETDTAPVLGPKGQFLVFENDRNLVIYDNANNPLWSSQTQVKGRKCVPKS